MVTEFQDPDWVESKGEPKLPANFLVAHILTKSKRQWQGRLGCAQHQFSSEMQIKTTMRCNFRPTRMTKIKSMTSNVVKEVKPWELLHTAGGSVITLEHSLAVSCSVMYTYPWQSNSIPMQYLRHKKVCPPKDCTIMFFTAALFIVAEHTSENISLVKM